MDREGMKKEISTLAAGAGAASLITLFGTYAYVLFGGRSIVAALVIDSAVAAAAGVVGKVASNRARRVGKRAEKTSPHP